MNSNKGLSGFSSRRQPSLLAVKLFALNIFLLNSLVLMPTGLSANSVVGINFEQPFQLCRQKSVGKGMIAAVASDNGHELFIAYQAGKIEKANLRKNSTEWVTNLGGEVISDFTSELGQIYLITKVLNDFDKEKNGGKLINDYYLWSINGETGITAWQFPFAANGSVQLNVLQTGLLLITNSETIIAVRKFDGQKIFERNIGNSLSARPVFSNNKIYIPTDENAIVIIAADNGEIISKIQTSHSPATVLTVDTDKLYWGEKTGFVNLVKLTDKSRRVRNVRQGGEVFSLDLVPNGILISSLDNFVSLISLQKGRKIWKRRLAGRISVKPLISGNFAVFVTAIDNSATILDLRDGKIVNQISLGDEGFALVTPLVVDNLLAFPTTKGIFAFANSASDCAYNRRGEVKNIFHLASPVISRT